MNETTADDMTMSDNQLPENYKYWREEGGKWGDEYDSRKLRMVYYHLQELYLVNYFEHSTPGRVMEYGCGVGRHLKNLVKIPGLEVHGYDQSISMVSNCLRWTTQEWIDQHIVVGNPVGRLPYPDKYFDIVFTSEVLIHVRPEDLPGLLKELIRITKWQILHIEPSPSFQVSSDTHNGCWNHNLTSVYGDLQRECEALPAVYSSQTPYRVILDPSRLPYDPISSAIDVMWGMEENLQPTINNLSEEYQRDKRKIQGLEVETTKLRSEIAISRKNIHDLAECVNNQKVTIDYQHDEVYAVNNRLQNIVDSPEFHLSEKLRSKRILFKLFQGISNGIDATTGLVRSIQNNNPVSTLKKSQIKKEAYSSLADGVFRIIGIDEKNSESNGSEIWLITSWNDRSIVQNIPSFVHGKWKEVFGSSGKNYSALVAVGPGYVDIRSEDVEMVIFRMQPWSGKVHIRYGQQEWSYDLYNSSEAFLIFHLSLMSARVVNELSFNQDGSIHLLPENISISSSSVIEKTKTVDIDIKGNYPLSIHNPEWLGIKHSALELFENNFGLPDNIDPERARVIAEQINNKQIPLVIIQGFPNTYQYLVNALSDYHIPVAVIWHGGFIQSDEDYGWTGFSTIVKLAREGTIKRVGFVKKGMAEVMAQAGVPSMFIMNYVNKIPEGPSQYLQNGHHIGIWSNFRKRPYVMIAASKSIPDARVHVWNGNERVIEFSDLLDVKSDVAFESIPQGQMESSLAEMEVNLNVSLYECAPMLPLQSLSVGSPCLFGPHSHYFEDHSYLQSRLVVPNPDRSDVISTFLRTAIAERKQIIEEYQDYAYRYNSEAKESVRRFMDLTGV